MSRTINLGHWKLPEVDNKLQSIYVGQTPRTAEAVSGDLPAAAPPSPGLLRNQPLCRHRADAVGAEGKNFFFAI